MSVSELYDTGYEPGEPGMAGANPPTLPMGPPSPGGSNWERILSQLAQQPPVVKPPEKPSGVERAMTYIMPLANTWAQSRQILNWRRRRNAFLGELAAGGMQTALTQIAAPRLQREALAEKQRAANQQWFENLTKGAQVAADIQRAQNTGLPESYTAMLTRRAMAGDAEAEQKLADLAAGTGMQIVPMPGQGIYRVPRAGTASAVQIENPAAETETPGAPGTPGEAPSLVPLVPPVKPTVPSYLGQVVRDAKGVEHTVYTDRTTKESWVVGPDGEWTPYAGEAPARQPRPVRPPQARAPSNATINAKRIALDQRRDNQLANVRKRFASADLDQMGALREIERINAAHDRDMETLLSGAAGKGEGKLPPGWTK